MRPNLVIVGLIGIIVAAAACDDTTAPRPVPRIATISNIDVIGHGGYADTVKVSFNYYGGGCDTGTVVQVRPIADGMRFTVTSWPTNQPCVLDVIAPPAVGYVVNPPHASPLRLVFTQPGGTDSVRVVTP